MQTLTWIVQGLLAVVFGSAVDHLTAVAAMGISHEYTAEENWANLERMFSGDPADREHRSKVMRIVREQSMEFGELNVEYGFSYEAGAIVADDSEPPASPDEVRIYLPSTRPGAPLPHAWIDDEDGNRRPIKDLVAPGRFLLIAGEEGETWCAAARELAAAYDLPLDAVRIGHLDGDLFDPRCAWLRQREIGSDGALLVRPDRFVAWRSVGEASDPAEALADAWKRLMAREARVAAEV
jgi:2,4-dichlorophenol 6-monooxygenase